MEVLRAHCKKKTLNTPTNQNRIFLCILIISKQYSLHLRKSSSRLFWVYGINWINRINWINWVHGVHGVHRINRSLLLSTLAAFTRLTIR